MNRIFLIGFMGSGKSHVGKKLAKALSLRHIDLDEWIVKKEGQSIPNIFKEGGEARFRELEHQHLLAMAEEEQVVISSGGGTPCFNDHIHWMNAHGLTIFLDLPEDRILERVLRKPEKRPLVAGKPIVELTLFIHDKLKERRGHYEEAQLIYRIAPKEQNILLNLLPIVQAWLK